MRLPFFHAHIRETGAQRRSDFHHDERIQGEKTIPGLNGVASKLRKSPTRSRILQRRNKGRENTSSVRFTRRMAKVARRFKLLIHMFSRLNNGRRSPQVSLFRQARRFRATRSRPTGPTKRQSQVRYSE